MTKKQQKNAQDNLQRLNPKTPNQSNYISEVGANDITICTGPAGTGKSHVAVGIACEYLQYGKTQKILIVRPIVESGNGIGWLPGSVQEKCQPYMVPIIEEMNKYLGKDRVAQLRGDDRIEICPLEFLRGRAQPVDTLIPTPTGMVKMGDLKVGDVIFGSDGKQISVTGVFPQGIKEVYKVSFADSTYTECCKEHLWFSSNQAERTRKELGKVRSTEDMLKKVKYKSGVRNYRIPFLSSPVDFPKKELPIPPYLMGILLGDGWIGDSITISSMDDEIIEKCQNLLREDHHLVKKDKINNRSSEYYLTSNDHRNNFYKRELEKLNLRWKDSSNKFISDIYKFSSTEDRVELLRGLMDSDGSIFGDKRNKGWVNEIRFACVSKNLSDDVSFLVRSLGGCASQNLKPKSDKVRVLNGSNVIANYDVHNVEIKTRINPFHLKRKAEKFNLTNFDHKKAIISIEKTREVECVCVKVDAEDSLYLTNDFIVTHNTFNNTIMILDEAQNATFEQLKMFMTRIGFNSKIIINGDTDQTDLKHGVRGGLDIIIQRLDGIPGIGIAELDHTDIVRNGIISKVLAALQGI